jgi:hypothetical protein
MYVKEASRRKGIAASLISCLEENLRERGVNGSIYIGLSTKCLAQFIDDKVAGTF